MKNCLNSFKDKRLKLSILTDLISILPIAGIFYLIQYWFIRASAKIDLSELQNIESTLVTNPQAAQQFLQDLANVYVVFGVVVIITIILTFLIYAISRNYLYSTFLKQKFVLKNSWKWLVIPFIFFLLLIPFIILSLLIHLIFSSIAGLFNSEMLSIITNNYLNLLLVIIFTVFIFIYHYIFAKKRELWSAIGDSFDFIIKKPKKFSFLLLYAFLTGVVINLLLLLPAVYLPYYFTLNQILASAMIILYLGWLRVYLLKILK